MFKFLVIMAAGCTYWALADMNAPLTQHDVAQYNGAYQQIEEQAARREAEALDAAAERAKRHADLVAKYRRAN